MAGSITSWEYLGGADWEATWTGTSPYRVFIDGKRQEDPDDDSSGQTTQTSRIFNQADTVEPPPLEVLDSTESAVTPDSQLNPSRAIVQWRGDVNVSQYLVQELVSGSYVDRRQFTENGSGYYKFESQPQDDGSVSFRVLAEDEAGVQSGPLDVTVLIVRNPAPPEISGAYVNPTLTISAR